MRRANASGPVSVDDEKGRSSGAAFSPTWGAPRAAAIGAAAQTAESHASLKHRCDILFDHGYVDAFPVPVLQAKSGNEESNTACDRAGLVTWCGAPRVGARSEGCVWKA
jgi:hypothetical protein